MFLITVLRDDVKQEVAKKESNDHLYNSKNYFCKFCNKQKEKQK